MPSGAVPSKVQQMDAQPADSADLLGDLLADRGVPHAVIDLDRFCQVWPAPEDDPFQHRLLLANLRAVADNYRPGPPPHPARGRPRHGLPHWHLWRAEELHLVLEAAGISDLTVDTTDLTPERAAAAVLEAAQWGAPAIDRHA
jgi:hypothetical protein